MNYNEIFNQVLNVDMDKAIEEESITESTDEDISSTDAAVIERYRAALDNNNEIELQFTGVSNTGSLYKIENNVKIILPVKLMKTEQQKLVQQGRKVRDNMLDKPMSVRILKIDTSRASSPVITVTSRPDRMVQRLKAIQAINDMLEVKDHNRIPARIIMVNKGRRIVILDIAGYGIRGYCRMEDWDIMGTNEISMNMIKPGDIAMVSVVGKYENHSDNKRYTTYRCVRKEREPYKNIDKKFPVGTVVRAMAMICDKRGYAFFKIDGFDTLNVLCPFPWMRDKEYENKSSASSIIAGHIYKIVITQSSEKNRKFKGRVLEEVKDTFDKAVYIRAEQRAKADSEQLIVEVQEGDMI